jgi:hypothetical protein
MQSEGRCADALVQGPENKLAFAETRMWDDELADEVVQARAGVWGTRVHAQVVVRDDVEVDRTRTVALARYSAYGGLDGFDEAQQIIGR